MKVNEMIVLPREWGTDLLKHLTDVLRGLARAVNTLLAYDVTVGNNLTVTGGATIGAAVIATDATAGFLWIPSCAGAPTGAPTAPYTGAAALVVDTTNSKLYVRVGTTWKSCTLT